MIADMSRPWVRHPVTSEAREIGILHDRVWRATYKDIAPAATLDALNQRHRIDYWKEVLDFTGCGRTLVAEVNGIISGMVTYGRPRHQCFGDFLELRHLYVDTCKQRSGLGRRLLISTVRLIERYSDAGVALAVVKENTKARRFYAAIGGEERDTFTDSGPLWRSTNVLVVLPRANDFNHASAKERDPI